MASMMTIRTYIFYGLWIVATILWSLFILVMMVLPYRWRHRIATGWADTSIWLVRLVCGIKWEVHGRENLPDVPVIMMVNHQSSWETLFMPILLRDQVWVLKNELLKIPIFGWAMASLHPVAINRKHKREAMTQVIGQGKNRIEYGFSVVMYPEGTRSAADNPRPFKLGAARLAEALAVPVLPVAHNAGQFWPRRGNMHPGTVQVRIGQMIDTTGLTAHEINERAEGWIAEQRATLVAAEKARRKDAP